MKSGARGGTPGPRSAAADVDAASPSCVNVAARSALFCSENGADEIAGFVFLLPGRPDKALLIIARPRGLAGPTFRSWALETYPGGRKASNCAVRFRKPFAI